MGKPNRTGWCQNKHRRSHQMKIVHAIRSLAARIGGPPMVAINVAARQIEAGHEVHLIFEDLGGELIDLPPPLSEEHLKMVPERTLASRIVDSDFARVAEPVIEDADILHVHGIWRRVPYRSMKFANMLGIPYLISPHGMLNKWALKQNPLRKKAAFLLGTWNLMEQADGVHALSDYEQQCIENHRLRAAVEKIPNGIDLSEIHPLPDRGAFRKKYPSLKKDGMDLPFILFLARLHPGKRLDLLIDSFAMVIQNLPELRLVVVGPDFGAKSGLERRIDELGLGEKVILTGPIWGREKFEPLIDATAYCLPSDHESFSVAIVEALATGCPVIISEECHFPEVKTSRSGYVCRLDVEQLAKAMHAIVIDDRMRKQMSENARRLVEENYQWSTISEKLTAFYNQLIRTKIEQRNQDAEVLSA